VFTDAIATARIPVLDVASRYTELGEALLPLVNPAIAATYGVEIPSFIVENVSVPQEVEQAIDKRSSMAAIGNLNEFVKYQMGKGISRPARPPAPPARRRWTPSPGCTGGRGPVRQAATTDLRGDAGAAPQAGISVTHSRDFGGQQRRSVPGYVQRPREDFGV
jgi:hypothetical protein